MFIRLQGVVDDGEQDEAAENNIQVRRQRALHCAHSQQPAEFWRSSRPGLADGFPPLF
jgi:hypothetical protein